MMDAGINNVIYMELHSRLKMANGTCGKTIVAGTMDRGSTVYIIFTHANHSYFKTVEYLNNKIYSILILINIKNFPY
jgi:mevalonate pyrophosphate decarboxylase